jgi:RNA polymerase sigma factor (sigma-70 family)
MECASLPEPAFRSQPDERLVALTRSGQARAFEEIVRRYRPALVRFAGRFVSDARAEDVVQEALVRSHRALMNGDSEIHLRSWLYRIVHNGAISDLRATRQHVELDESIDGVPQPPDIFERREELRGVVKRLKALPDSQRQAIVASELEGTSHDEIARTLETTPGGVSQLIFRARTSLRAAGAFLFPLPLARWFSSLFGGSAGSAGIAGGTTAAITGTTGAKVGSTLAAAVLLVGSGAALKGEGSPVSADAKPATERSHRGDSVQGDSVSHSADSTVAHGNPAASAAPGGSAGESTVGDSSGGAGSGETWSAVGSGAAEGSGADVRTGGGNTSSGDAGSTPSEPSAEHQPPPPGGDHFGEPAPSQPPPGGSYSGEPRPPRYSEPAPSGSYSRPPRMHASGDTYTAPPPPGDGETSYDGTQPPPDGYGDGEYHH